jgi:hypothetical protein
MSHPVTDVWYTGPWVNSRPRSCDHHHIHLLPTTTSQDILTLVTSQWIHDNINTLRRVCTRKRSRQCATSRAGHATLPSLPLLSTTCSTCISSPHHASTVTAVLFSHYCRLHEVWISTSIDVTLMAATHVALFVMTHGLRVNATASVRTSWSSACSHEVLTNTLFQMKQALIDTHYTHFIENSVSLWFMH